MQDTIIAVTGGSTLAEVAAQLSPSSQLKGHVFVPARGGLGENVELQANSIASTMAKKTKGKYRMLHVPDHLPDEAYQSLIQDPNIREIIHTIRSASVIIHGIGEAKVMASRRKVDKTTNSELEQEGAIGEAYGYYFDQDGRVVHKMPTLGLRLEDLPLMHKIIAVAGGKSKAKAIAAVLRYGQEHVLITDEAAAREILTPKS
jgi:central glycolytic genes regulator